MSDPDNPTLIRIRVMDRAAAGLAMVTLAAVAVLALAGIGLIVCATPMARAALAMLGL